MFDVQNIHTRLHSSLTHILQGVGGDALRQSQAINSSYHHQYISPGTLEQWTSPEARPKQILHEQIHTVKTWLEQDKHNLLLIAENV